MRLTSLFSTPELPPVGGGVAVVTGATSGIGEATARMLIDENFSVIGTTRDPSNVARPIAGVTYVGLDLADPESIATCAASILEVGVPEVIVNNAGESQSGPFEELPREAIERLFQVNVIGHVDLTQRLLPAMRDAGRGRIVMVGSMLGSFPLGFRSSYVASKAAIKGFASAARRELAPFGIGISTVEPGSIATGISQRRTRYIDTDGPYAADYTRMARALDANESRGITAERVAREILKPISATRPRPHYATGSMAPVAFPLSRVVPQQVMLNVLSAKHDLLD
ncbi:SDR family oxidoreductase [Corynebacterium aquatimens]|uniref:NAD(P)-dependent dehydrogenase (Short-subunit alcohol dehydrogenase family) n=1 Tax=Corynebacterium aquatimens TaxID=1190508 RepID=A0A931E054_9CORY|nr:SDR family oxidoreductase [Corynebacterium aquatimens]MBG6122269.1 NAD(P)-dependent dehydrogenase (short-subunit alcohol dehydrogenase family) [Corynebacterium aquatimens]WJY65190.1 3-oxoacyl-[acyl-carrier-protein] reductase FabG [Corynebacterium aquatimens]